MMIRFKEKGTTLTWGPGPSSDPGSKAIAAPAAAVAIAVAMAAAGAPGGDHPQTVVVAVGPED
jgi:multisubunit Na+/H+ antiporter MnhB subunit